jgi:hypothetical protein
MAALYPKFHVTKSGLAGTLNVSDSCQVTVDHDVDPENWKVFDPISGDFSKIADVKGANKLTIAEFIGNWKEFQAEDEKKEDAVKCPDEQQVTDQEKVPEEMPQENDDDKKLSDIEKLEALERGEIEKPAPKTNWKRHPATMAAKNAEQDTGRTTLSKNILRKKA